MDVRPVVDRLKEALKPLRLREVGSAAGLDAAMAGVRSVPAVFVIPLSERASELGHTGAVDQIERRLFGVLQVVDSRAPTGSTGVVDLVALRQAIKVALIGWVPEEETGEPVLFVGGELVEFKGDGQLWWSDEFLLTGYFRSTQ